MRPRLPTIERAGSCAISDAPAPQQPDERPPILESVSDYYSGKLEQHGPTPAGVDWSSEQSQKVRFAQLLQLIEGPEQPSVIDYGCGYGALAEVIMERYSKFTYIGYDIAHDMVEVARSLVGDPRCRFTSSESDLTQSDYTVASGIFNVKLRATDTAWHEYVVRTLDVLAALSTKGFAFNMLTRYADPPLMRGDLYYADPGSYFRLCKERYARDVALLHDYELYEFTILVRSGSAPKPLAG